MPNFKYSAKKGPDETVEGVVSAQDRDSAIDIVSAMGYMPLSVEVVSAGAVAGSQSNRKAETVQKNDAPRSKRVKLRDVVVFSGQLSRLLKAGVPILRALNIILEQTNNRYLKYAVSHIANDIKSGSTLSKAMSNYPAIFPSIYISIVRAGENSGALNKALERISDYLKKQDEFVSKIRVALIYPIFMASVGAATVLFMLVFVIPRIKGIYASAGETLPLPTRILIATSEGIIHNWVWILIVCAAAYFGIKKFLSKRNDLASIIKLNLPIYGQFILKAELSRVIASMELSLKNGIQILKSIELALPVSNNEIIKKELFIAYEQVEQGRSFGENLKKSKLFPPFMTSLIIVGEESGRLDEMLGEVSDYLQKDTEETLKIFTSQFEPMMILAIGSVLGFIVISVLLPIFQLNLMAK